MKSIVIDKDHFEQFLESYDWGTLSDSNEGLFPKPFMFTPQIMASIFSQFQALFVLDNDTIWGSYNDRLLLVAKAKDIYLHTEQAVLLK